MSIVVTGATGNLGRLVVESLLRRGVPADRITALGRDTARLAGLRDLGVTARPAEYDHVDALRAAFAGADTLMFVSGSDAERRMQQHRNVVAAAKDAGIGRTVYTSIANAERSSLKLAAQHRATEQEILGAGLPYVFLGNSWYMENYTGQLPTYLEHGIVGAAGDGRVSAATRADFAEAAAAVLAGDGPVGQRYELGGAGFTMSELASEVSRQTGRPVSYTDLPEDKYVEVLVGFGIPESYAALLADGDRGLAQGELYVEGDDLEQLIGRPPTSLAEAVRAAL